MATKKTAETLSQKLTADVEKRTAPTIIEVGGKTYVLKLGVNRLIDAERRLGMSTQDFVEKLQTGSLATLHGFMAAVLRDIDGKPISDDEAGDVLEHIGVPEMGEIIGESLARLFQKKAA